MQLKTNELNTKVDIYKVSHMDPLTDPEYTLFKNVWCKMINAHGKEFVDYDKNNIDLSKKITIRYLKELDPSIHPNCSKEYIIKYKGLMYDLLYCDNVREQNESIEIGLKLV